MYSKLSTFSVLLLTALNTTNLYAGTVGNVEKEPAPPGYSLSVTPFYGAINDEGIRKLYIAKTIGSGNNTTYVKTHFPDNDSNWGIAASVGYRFNPLNDVVLSYAYLSTRGQRSVYNTTGGVLTNTLSQIANFGAQDLTGAAVASVKTKFSYQTGDLITRRLFSAENYQNIQFSRFFGIKAAYFTKRFDAVYAGNINAFGGPFLLRDGINYEAKYYGIGPRIGMGGRWFFNRYISLGGDVSASLLVGAYDNEWRETLTTDFGIAGLPQNGTYQFNQRTDSNVWIAPVLAGNLSVAGNFDVPNNSVFQIEGGIGSEQYLPQLNADAYSHPNNTNKLRINQHFMVRNIFIKLSYFC
ncbi:TPA: Lpg1974 family pore-forming outer membrane protein [Legionella feeleii]